MCTLSLICICEPEPESEPETAATADSRRACTRLAFSRDEAWERVAGLPPAVHLLADGTRAIWPTDPAGGGTWIAVTSHGLMFALLNRTLPSHLRDSAPRPGLRSRGLIIPALVAAPTLEEAVAQARESVNPADYRPYRLVIADRTHHVIGDWHGPHSETGDSTTSGLPPSAAAAAASWTEGTHASGALVLGSSGLGDSRVERPRQALFHDLMFERPEPDGPSTNGGRHTTTTADRQDRFHRHQWPDDPSISVRMVRSGARTVSITSVQIDQARASMTLAPFDRNMRELPGVQVALPLANPHAVR